LTFPPFNNASEPIVSSVNVGLRYNTPSSTKLLDLLFVYHWNSQLPPILYII
jgi:hypothetical protein